MGIGRPKKNQLLSPRGSLNKDPEWKRVVDRVLFLKHKGYTQDQILSLVEADKHAVLRILEDEAIADERARLEWDKKIPTIKEIMSCCLSTVRDEMLRISSDKDYRSMMIRGVRDVALLTNMARDLNTLLRLELGQSTENVSIKQSVTHSYQQTRAVIQDLKKVDPVFDYPELPPPPSESNGLDD